MTRRDFLQPAFLVALAVLVLTASSLSSAIAYFGVYLRKLPIEAPQGRKVHAVPHETESWRRLGSDRVESAEMVEELGTQNYLSRSYVRRDTPEDQPPLVLDLHMAYYTGMIDTVPHVPERCMTGGGWIKATGSRTYPLDLGASEWVPDTKAPEGTEPVLTARLSNRFGSIPGARIRLPRDAENLQIRVTEFADPRSGNKVYAGYFFIANGGWTASAEGVRLLAFNLRDDYAYYLKVQVSGHQASTAEEFVSQASSLLRELLPEIMRCVPDWVEVERGMYPDDNPRRAGNAA